MKRLITTFAILGAVLILPAQTLAAHFWQVTMSDPSVTSQSRAFNLDYVALSTEDTDQITVKLLENGTQIGSQTTIGGGDSGSFLVQVPSDGSYSYNMQATSSEDGSMKSTDTKLVTVATPVEGQPSDVSVSTVPSSGGNGSSAGVAGDATGQQDSEDGDVEAATDQAGTVDDEAATDENQPSDDDSNKSILLYGLAAAIIAGLAYYIYRIYKAQQADES